nr:unnamed protein product [Callosobruchus analis]
MLDLLVSDMGVQMVRDTSPLIHEDLHHLSLFGNYIGLYNALTYLDWPFHTTDINLMSDMFYEKLYYVFNLYVPKITAKRRGYPKWYTSKLMKNIKKV